MTNMKVVGKRLLCIVLAVAMLSFSLQDFEVDTYAAEQEVPETSQSTEDFQRKVVPEEPDINRYRGIPARRNAQKPKNGVERRH